MKAPVGALVRLYYDSPVRVAPGYCLVTKTARTYIIMSVRVQARGKHAGRRQHLACPVAREPPLDEAGRMHSLRWHHRPVRRRG